MTPNVQIPSIEIVRNPLSIRQVFRGLLRALLLMVLFGAATSYSHPQEEASKDPISLKEIEREFAAARKEARPVKIENRIIEGAALDYLNDNLADGPGITFQACEIRGDLNFVKHAKLTAGVARELNPTALDHVRQVEAKRAQVIKQAIRIEESEIGGSLIASTYSSISRFWPDIIAVFQNDVAVSGKIGKSAYFSKTYFNEGADFHAAEFAGDASFSSARFNDVALFQKATFGGNADFDGAKFTGGAGFGATIFGGSAQFHWGKFNGATFRSATFKGRADFGAAVFSEHVDLSVARFGDDVSFLDARFNCDIDAQRVSFRRGAVLAYVVFVGEVDFTGSEFGGITSFVGTRFALPPGRTKVPIDFSLCTFGSLTNFSHALFQEAVTFNSSVLHGEVSFANVRFKDSLDLSGILLARSSSGKAGALSFVGARCEDIFFGVSQPSFIPRASMPLYYKRFRFSDEDIGVKRHEMTDYQRREHRLSHALARAERFLGMPLPDNLEPGCSIDLTGTHYSRLLFLDWGKLQPALEEALRRDAVTAQRACKAEAAEHTDTPDPKVTLAEKVASGTHALDSETDLADRRNAALAAFRLLAKNYEAVGSKSDAQKAYGFYRQKALEFQPTFIDKIIWWTTGFGAHKRRLAYWFGALWLIPWGLGYWRPGVIVAADEKLEPPNDTLWNWVGTLSRDPFLRQLHMAGFSLWFSFHTLIPGIEFFGFKKWTPSYGKIHEVLPVRYQTLATLQRISGWLLLPIAIAAFTGLFEIR